MNGWRRGETHPRAVLAAGGRRHKEAHDRIHVVLLQGIQTGKAGTGEGEYLRKLGEGGLKSGATNAHVAAGGAGGPLSR